MSILGITNSSKRCCTFNKALGREQRGNRGVVSAGFTLLEVMIALAILAVSLMSLLQIQSSSLRKSGLSREITIATLLARSKMIDLEQTLLDDGFTEGEQTEEGDFSDEGYKEITWTASINEMEMRLDSMMGLCESLAGEDMDCEAMMGGMGGMFDGFMKNFAQSIRLITLKVKWPVGSRYSSSMEVQNLVTRDDYKFASSTFGGQGGATIPPQQMQQIAPLLSPGSIPPAGGRR